MYNNYMLGSESSVIRNSGLYVVLLTMYVFSVCSFVSFSDVKRFEGHILYVADTTERASCLLVKLNEKDPKFLRSEDTLICLFVDSQPIFRKTEVRVDVLMMLEQANIYRMCVDEPAVTLPNGIGSLTEPIEVHFLLKRAPVSILRRLWRATF